MAEAESPVDSLKLALPVSLVSRTNRIVIDIGGSLAKYVFCPDEEWSRVLKENSSVVNCTCLTFHREAIEAAGDYILVQMTPPSKAEVFATGVGSTEFQTSIESKFDIKLKVQYEIDEVVRGLMFSLHHLPFDDVIHPVESSERTRQYLDGLVDINTKYADLHISGVITWKSHRLRDGYAKHEMDRLQQPLGVDDDAFPCIVAMCGSMHGYQMVYADGSYSPHDVDFMGGKTLLAMCSMLLGTQDFHKVLKMASDGNAAKVDFTEADFRASCTDHNDDPYKAVFSSSAPSAMFLPFGKISEKSKDKMATEDIAASLLNLFVVKFVASLRAAVAATKVKNVYLCGSFVNHEFMRKKITEEIFRREVLYYTFNGQPLEFQFRFFRHAAYMCSLGMIVSQANQANSKVV